jgi:uncharacterized protein (DUF1697 family)
MAKPRWAAFLRGVYPNNPSLADLRACYEEAGFDDVSTVLSSGNVVFSAAAASKAATLERKAELVMAKRLHRPLVSVVRSIADLRALLDGDPYAPFRLAPGSKRVVTFLKEPQRLELALPTKERDGARILAATEREVFTAYVPEAQSKGGSFMKVLEDALGSAITTRTWETVKKVVARGEL